MKDIVSSEFLEVVYDKFLFRVQRGNLYTRDDLWLRREDSAYRVGLTDFAQRVAGDVAFVKLASPGATLGCDETLAEIETIKTTLVVGTPTDGQVLEVNEALTDNPERINEDPYGEGWIALLKSADCRPLFLDADAYFALMNERLVEEDRKRQAK